MPTKISFSDEQKRLIKKKYQEGETTRSLGKEFGCSKPVIVNLLREEGVLRKPFSKTRPNYPYKKVNTVTGHVKLKLAKGDPFYSMVGKDGYVFEHRIVMARSIERPLSSKETVHYINGNTMDNRIENLQLRVSNHGPGVVLCCADCGSSNIIEGVI